MRPPPHWQETEARVSSIKEEMGEEMKRENKKAAQDQTHNLELQRAQVNFQVDGVSEVDQHGHCLY